MSGRTQISRKVEIDMGHRLPDYEGKCKNLHGHRYCIEVLLEGAILNAGSNEGMVVDFSFCKELLTTHVHDAWDHGMMLYEGDPFLSLLANAPENTKLISVPFIPTAENIAKAAFEKLEKPFEDKGVKLIQVKVWETPNCYAIYKKVEGTISKLSKK